MSGLPDPKWVDKILASVQKRGGRVIIGDLTIERAVIDQSEFSHLDSDEMDEEAEIHDFAEHIRGAT